MATLSSIKSGTRSALRRACVVQSQHSSIGRQGGSNNILRIQKASKSSSAFADYISESIRENVKSSVLDHAASDKVWSTPPSRTNNAAANGHINGSGGVNDVISSLHDPLDDLFLTQPTRYWPSLPPNVQIDADPFLLSKQEVETLSQSIREDLLGTDHPVLNKAASYFFGSADGGKKVRPMMVMLLSRALANAMTPNSEDIQPETTSASLFSRPFSWQRSDLPQAQRRLAEISEMIHTASLFHDDVIDGSDTRRGQAAVHMVFGNKMAILAGDYLLARASICLARLRHVEVVETMSTIIEHLVRGEVMQMRGTQSSQGKNERMVYYLKKNFYKTGSLMANSCKSAALLGDCSPELVAASYRYGKHVGMAFQLADDVLDFEGNVSSMGKPALADLNAGLSTAPVLFAAEDYPELEPMMDRKFKLEGDVERAVELVFASDGIERTKQMARVHAELAMEAALELEPSVHRDALINLAYKVVSRTK
jgi:geranylgeranyl pyrophosphate synthase